MCATPDKQALKELRSRKGTQRGWKVLNRRSGKLQAEMNPEYTYTAGVNRPKGQPLKVGQYKITAPRGLHVFQTRKTIAETWGIASWQVLMPVTYAPRDVIAAEMPGMPWCQVVVRKLRISQRAYNKAMK